MTAYSHEALMALLREKLAVYETLELQVSQFGTAYAPAHILNQYKAVQREVLAIEAELGIPAENSNVLSVRYEARQALERSQYNQQARRRDETQRFNDSQRQQSIKAQIELLTICRRTFAILRRQADAFGGLVFAPVSVQNQYTESLREIRRIKTALINYGVLVDHMPGE